MNATSRCYPRGASTTTLANILLLRSLLLAHRLTNEVRDYRRPVDVEEAIEIAARSGNQPGPRLVSCLIADAVRPHAERAARLARENEGLRAEIHESHARLTDAGMTGAGLSLSVRIGDWLEFEDDRHGDLAANVDRLTKERDVALAALEIAEAVDYRGDDR